MNTVSEFVKVMQIDLDKIAATAASQADQAGASQGAAPSGGKEAFAAMAKCVISAMMAANTGAQGDRAK
eukprot:8836605-Alexandrium_andersonii.AAC.1